MHYRFFITLTFLSHALYITALTTNEPITFESTESYVMTHNLDEESFSNIFQQGNDFFKKEKYTEAEQLYKKALEYKPTCAHTWFNLGQTYYWQKKYPQALDSFKKTIQYEPSHQHVYAQIGRLLFDVKQYEDAIRPLERALELNPGTIDIYLLLSRSYCSKHLFDKALTLLQKGLNNKPHDVNLRFELANVYNHLNRLDESLELYKKLDSIAPYNPSIIYNIGFTLKKLGRTEESLAYYNKAIELNPQHNDALFSRGLAYLVLGDFEKGWEGYEYRYHKPDRGCLRTHAQPRWDGTDLTDRTILLHAEQGFGDTFQFIRYAKVIKDTKNPKRIIAAVQKPLITAIGLCPYIDEVISVDDSSAEFDTHAPIMSLPYILKTRLGTIPCEIPYLFANETLVQEWKRALENDKNIKIGICVQGNQNYATPQLQLAVALKSINVDQLAPICAVEGISIYSLQKMTGTDQFNNLPENMNIITFDGDFDQSHGRFMDTVAVLKNLDLIITVDTSICHLAAALGKPTWVMLPNPADWRWMQNKTDTPWYPTMRLFKQPKPGDWETMIAEVAQELAKFVENKKAL